MNERLPTNEVQGGRISRREARLQRRQARQAGLGGSGFGSAALIGVILILLGGLLLTQNIGAFSIPYKNWGALFILIPAFGAFLRAWRMYQAAGTQVTAPVLRALLIGLVLLMITGVILFDLNWTVSGPVLVIVLGAGILITGLIHR